MKKFYLVDQHGEPFNSGDIPATKDYKFCKIEEETGKVFVLLDENKIEIFESNIPNCYLVWSHIKDNKNVIKVSDCFLVKEGE